jgi:hypothetical protein
VVKAGQAAVGAVIVVILLLASSVIVNITGIAPNPLGKAIQGIFTPQLTPGSVYGEPFITDTSGNTQYYPNVQALSSVSGCFGTSCSPVTLYNSASSAQGAFGDAFFVNLNVQNGTDTAVTTTLTVAIQSGGQTLQLAYLSASGATCAAPCQVSMNAGQIARGGSSVIADFGSSAAAASKTYSFAVVSGQVCVTFKEQASPVCHALSPATINTATLNYVPSASTVGSYSVSVTGTPSTQSTSGTTSTSTATTSATQTTTVCQAGQKVVNGQGCPISALSFWG